MTSFGKSNSLKRSGVPNSDEGDSDFSTKSTADDALACKYSSMTHGYFSDPFLAAMLSKSHSATFKSMKKKPPIINRGYYARVECIRVLVSAFLKGPESTTEGDKVKKKRQILNLGCGFDTMSLQLLNNYNSGIEGNSESEDFIQKRDEMELFELDFNDVVRQKANYLTTEPTFQSTLFPSSAGGGEVTTTSVSSGSECAGAGAAASGESKTDNRISWKGNGTMIHTAVGPIKLVGCDLRRANEVTNALLAAGFDPTLPTMIITECVLVYHEKRYTDALCRALGDLLTGHAVWVSYDMVNSQDVYGRMMFRNLTGAGFTVPGFSDYPTLESQEKRFRETGWGISSSSESEHTEKEEEGEEETQEQPSQGGIESTTMLAAYNNLVTPEEKVRIARLQIFDEIEEWNMLMSHYCLTIAEKGEEEI